MPEKITAAMTNARALPWALLSIALFDIFEHFTAWYCLIKAANNQTR